MIQLLTQKIPVGISQCALGDPVRYNGRHKLSRVCTELLSRCFDYVPFCPEVAIGLGVPRPPIHLVASDRLRAVGVNDPDMDVTEALEAYADRVVPRVAQLRGFILMQKSPSCGVGSTPRYLPGEAEPLVRGAGLFSERLRAHFPHLPMEEAGRLDSREIRGNFLTRVFAYDAWHRYVAPDPRPAKVIDFYSAYKYLLLAHHQELTRELGRFLSDAKSPQPGQLAHEVRGRIMSILAHPASRENRTNALMHSQGHLREFLNREEKAELAQLIEDYRLGRQPLSAVLSLLRRHLPRSPHAFIHSQVLLAAEPEACALADSQQPERP